MVSCVLGNPPWEEIKVEERSFWNRFEPGLWSLPMAKIRSRIKELKQERPDLLKLFEQEKRKAKDLVKVISNGPYLGFGTGDADVYKAFSMRFWNQISPMGVVGVVLPRSVLVSSGRQIGLYSRKQNIS